MENTTIKLSNNNTIELTNAEKDFLNDSLTARDENDIIYFCDDDRWCAQDSFTGTESEAKEMLEATDWAKDAWLRDENGKYESETHAFDELLADFISACQIIEEVDGKEI